MSLRGIDDDLHALLEVDVGHCIKTPFLGHPSHKQLSMHLLLTPESKFLEIEQLVMYPWCCI